MWVIVTATILILTDLPSPAHPNELPSSKPSPRLRKRKSGRAEITVLQLKIICARELARYISF